MKIIESPREGLQGLERLVSFGEKLQYIQSLLKVGFDTVEVGSFVSPRLIPQMADTAKILDQLDYSANSSNIMALIVNKKGTDLALSIPHITLLSFPFSFSRDFIRHNLNTTLEDCLHTLDHLLNSCAATGKTPVIYISMAFGNPYGNEWNVDILLRWIEKLRSFGVYHIPLSNVNLEITPELILTVYSQIFREFKDLDIGLHLHTTQKYWKEKAEAAYDAGCRRFDTVMLGYGGCPMAGGPMMGNLDTLNFSSFLNEKQIPSPLNLQNLSQSAHIATKIFS